MSESFFLLLLYTRKNTKNVATSVMKLLVRFNKKVHKIVRKKLFFFFKQKTAYEMLRSLVGSEMCIRDSSNPISYFVKRHKDLSLFPTYPTRNLFHGLLSIGNFLMTSN